MSISAVPNCELLNPKEQQQQPEQINKSNNNGYALQQPEQMAPRGSQKNKPFILVRLFVIEQFFKAVVVGGLRTYTIYFNIIYSALKES